jgi:hypothetical protein
MYFAFPSQADHGAISCVQTEDGSVIAQCSDMVSAVAIAAPLNAQAKAAPSLGDADDTEHGREQNAERNNPDAIFKTYTVFCQDEYSVGTTWIDTVEAVDIEAARVEAVEACAAAWECEPSGVCCVGVAEGDVKILFWQD